MSMRPNLVAAPGPRSRPSRRSKCLSRKKGKISIGSRTWAHAIAGLDPCAHSLPPRYHSASGKDSGPLLSGCVRPRILDDAEPRPCAAVGSLGSCYFSTDDVASKYSFHLLPFSLYRLLSLFLFRSLLSLSGLNFFVKPVE